MFYVMIVDAGRLLASNTDCYSGTGILDPLQSCGIYFGPVMSHLNSKICLSVKGSVYLFLYSDLHRKWSAVLTPSDFLFDSKNLFEAPAAVRGAAVSRAS